jgi:predicted acylesterase/phospholipase RssA
VAAGRARELPGIWRSLAGRSVVSLERALWNRSPFDMSWIVRSTLRAQFDGAIDLRAAPLEALVVATRLRDLRPVVFSSREEPDLTDALLASCFIPLFYGRPVRLRGALHVDGGLRDNLPIAPLCARGAEEIVAVVARSDGTALKRPLLRFRPSPADAAGRPVHVICPRAPLRIGPWDFRRDAIERALDEGFEQGARFAARRRAAG